MEVRKSGTPCFLCRSHNIMIYVSILDWLWVLTQFDINILDIGRSQNFYISTPLQYVCIVTTGYMHIASHILFSCLTIGNRGLCLAAAIFLNPLITYRIRQGKTFVVWTANGNSR